MNMKLTKKELVQKFRELEQLVEEEIQRLGGAGSVAVNVCVLGAHTTLVGLLGFTGAMATSGFAGSSSRPER